MAQDGEGSDSEEIVLIPRACIAAIREAVRVLMNEGVIARPPSGTPEYHGIEIRTNYPLITHVYTFAHVRPRKDMPATEDSPCGQEDTTQRQDFDLQTIQNRI